jgi:hypothetical protein
MSKSLMQNQRELDDSAEIEGHAEKIEQELREELLDGGYYDLWHRGGIKKRRVYDSSDVISAMIDLDSNTFDAAIMLSGKDPLQGAKALAELMARAVDHLVAEAPTLAAAKFEIENKEKAA